MTVTLPPATGWDNADNVIILGKVNGTRSCPGLSCLAVCNVLTN